MSVTEITNPIVIKIYEQYIAPLNLVGYKATYTGVDCHLFPATILPKVIWKRTRSNKLSIIVEKAESFCRWKAHQNHAETVNLPHSRVNSLRIPVKLSLQEGSLDLLLSTLQGINSYHHEVNAFARMAVCLDSSNVYKTTLPGHHTQYFYWNHKKKRVEELGISIPTTNRELPDDYKMVKANSLEVVSTEELVTSSIDVLRVIGQGKFQTGNSFEESLDLQHYRECMKERWRHFQHGAGKIKRALHDCNKWNKKLGQPDQQSLLDEVDVLLQKVNNAFDRTL